MRTRVYRLPYIFPLHRRTASGSLLTNHIVAFFAGALVNSAFFRLHQVRWKMERQPCGVPGGGGRLEVEKRILFIIVQNIKTKNSLSYNKTRDDLLYVYKMRSCAYTVVFSPVYSFAGTKHGRALVDVTHYYNIIRFLYTHVGTCCRGLSAAWSRYVVCYDNNNNNNNCVRGSKITLGPRATAPEDVRFSNRRRRRREVMIIANRKIEWPRPHTYRRWHGARRGKTMTPDIFNGMTFSN